MAKTVLLMLLLRRGWRPAAPAVATSARPLPTSTEDIEFESIGEVDGFHVEVEPQARFEVDRQQVIESFRALVAITAEGGGTGDELRRLADLELESSLDNRLSEDESPPAGRAGSAARDRHLRGISGQIPGSRRQRHDLYQLSRAYALEDENDKSMALLDRLATDYPESQVHRRSPVPPRRAPVRRKRFRSAPNRPTAWSSTTTRIRCFSKSPVQVRLDPVQAGQPHTIRWPVSPACSTSTWKTTISRNRF